MTTPQDSAPAEPEAVEAEVLDRDAPPSGDWVDTDEALADLSDEEAEEGREQGEKIDTEDDEDAG